MPWLVSVDTTSKQNAVTFMLTVDSCRQELRARHSIRNSIFRGIIVILPSINVFHYSARNVVVTFKSSNSFTPKSKERILLTFYRNKCRSEVVRIGSIIIFRPSKLWKAKFSMLCDATFHFRGGGGGWKGSVFSTSPDSSSFPVSQGKSPWNESSAEFSSTRLAQSLSKRISPKKKFQVVGLSGAMTLDCDWSCVSTIFPCRYFSLLSLLDLVWNHQGFLESLAAKKC